MKWFKWDPPGGVVQHYHLVEGRTLRETVRFEPLQKSARIYCGDQQRVFFIKNPGKKFLGYNIENEYGFIEGNIKVVGSTGNEMVCSIGFGQRQSHFTLHHSHTPEAELVTLHPDYPGSGFICSLPAEPAGTRLRKAAAISLTNLHATLIWSLHWWLLMGDIGKETTGHQLSPLHGAKILVH